MFSKEKTKPNQTLP